MKLKPFIPFFYTLIIFCLSVMTLPLNQNPTEESELVNHKLWDEVLLDNVSESGIVNYKGISNSNKFKKYLDQLSHSNPFGSNWTKNDQLSFWLNAYNAFTVKLIIDNHVKSSIKEITNPWGLDFIEINNELMSLGQIEHDILRMKQEPRIHFAIVCASKSCPMLLNHAYQSDQLDLQLASQTKLFINDNNKNSLNRKELSLSKIFKWFMSDFTSENDLIYFINRYSTLEISSDANISFKKYDWDLNN